jgi:hypothetical protein
MVVITILLASMFTVGFLDMNKFDTINRQSEKIDNLGDRDSGGGLVWAAPNTAGAEASHHMNYYIPSDSNTAGNSLNSVTINYDDGVDLSGVDARSDVTKAGFDTDGDGSIETEVTDDIECCPPDDGVTVSDSGTTVRVEFSGNYNTPSNATFVIVYDDVTNGAAGNHSATVTLNGDVSKSGKIDLE